MNLSQKYNVARVMNVIFDVMCSIISRRGLFFSDVCVRVFFCYTIFFVRGLVDLD